MSAARFGVQTGDCGLRNRFPESTDGSGLGRVCSAVRRLTRLLCRVLCHVWREREWKLGQQRRSAASFHPTGGTSAAEVTVATTRPSLRSGMPWLGARVRALRRFGSARLHVHRGTQLRRFVRSRRLQGCPARGSRGFLRLTVRAPRQLVGHDQLGGAPGLVGPMTRAPEGRGCRTRKVERGARGMVLAKAAACGLCSLGWSLESPA